MTKLTKRAAKEYLDGQIARGSGLMRGTGGSINGWRQLRRDVGQMLGDLCRTDAVGRISKSDREVFLAVVEEYRVAGKIGPEWAGYLTIK